MPLPFVDRASSALPVQLVPQPKWKAWLKEQTAARRAWLESSGGSGHAGDISVLPGRDGLLHISQIANERVNAVSDHLKEGQVVKVKVLEADEKGRVRLSMKAVQEQQSADAQ